VFGYKNMNTDDKTLKEGIKHLKIGRIKVIGDVKFLWVRFYMGVK